MQACEPLELDPPGAAGPGAVTKLAAGAAGVPKRVAGARGGRGGGAGGARRGGRGGGEEDEEDEDGETRRQEVQQEEEEEEEEEEASGAATGSSSKREWRGLGGQLYKAPGRAGRTRLRLWVCSSNAQTHLAGVVPAAPMVRSLPTCALLVPNLHYIPFGFHLIPNPTQPNPTQPNPTQPNPTPSLPILPGAVLMVCVGTGGALGGVWRSPPLALSEFSTHPAESLNPHSLEGLTAMLRPGDPAHGCLTAAARAQALRAAALEVSVRHNGVLLDGIVRKLDRRRRVLMWRRAAMEGGTDGKVGVEWQVRGAWVEMEIR